MGTIHGPYDQADFRTMRDLKNSIKFYMQHGHEQYQEALRKEKAILKDYFRKAA